MMWKDRGGRTSISRPQVVLWGANLLMVAAVISLPWVGLKRDEILSAPGEPIEVEALVDFGSHAPAKLLDLQTKALFHATRRFYVAPLVVEQAVVEPPPVYRIMGILSSKSKAPIALLKQEGSRRRVKVAVGDLLDGWTVTNVESGKVSLQRNGRDAELVSAGRSRSSGLKRLSEETSGVSAPTAVKESVSGSRMMRRSRAAGALAAAVVGNEAMRDQNSSQTREDAPRLFRPPAP